MHKTTSDDSALKDVNHTIVSISEYTLKIIESAIAATLQCTITLNAYNNLILLRNFYDTKPEKYTPQI